MLAMLLDLPGTPLRLAELPDPEPAAGEVRIRVAACGVCRTDLHVVDGDLPPGPLPIIPGHEIVGRIDRIGPGVADLAIGQRVGVGWLGRACERCSYCLEGRENLCDAPLFTGYTRHGGFATHAVADARYTFPLGEAGDDAATAPLLCAGLIGWRSLQMAGDGRRLGIYGFGAAGHIVLQVARWQGKEVYVFTRPDDRESRDFALRLGAAWAGPSDRPAPVPLDAAILYAPVGALVPAALRAVRKGGRVVCAGIHMSDIPSFPYRQLWEEREIRSVANLTRADARGFLEIAPRAGVETAVTVYPLAAANAALDDLRAGRVQGAAVLRP
ncbi:alcohol dehydrogenase [Allostella sp. ATCC 35155]|nr:alcohol dehydrogenase [Stella sp. ATCC 35155]